MCDEGVSKSVWLLFTQDFACTRRKMYLAAIYTVLSVTLGVLAVFAG